MGRGRRERGLESAVPKRFAQAGGTLRFLTGAEHVDEQADDWGELQRLRAEEAVALGREREVQRLRVELELLKTSHAEQRKLQREAAWLFSRTMLLGDEGGGGDEGSL